MTLKQATDLLKAVVRGERPHRELEGLINVIEACLKEKHVSRGDTIWMVEQSGNEGTNQYLFVEYEDAVAAAREITRSSPFTSELDVDDDSWELWSELTHYEDSIEIYDLRLR